MAYQFSEEDRKGLIEVAKLADFVIVDRNPLTVDPMDLREIQIVETIKPAELVPQQKTK